MTEIDIYQQILISFSIAIGINFVCDVLMKKFESGTVTLTVGWFVALLIAFLESKGIF